MSGDDLVRVSIRYKPGEDLPAAENMWAAPVDANDGGGLYRLENSSVMVPLAAGDLVRAELAGDGRLQVTDVHQPCPSVLMVTEVLGEVAGAETDETISRWAAAGAVWTEGHGQMLVTVWGGESIEEILELVKPDIQAGRVHLLAMAPPEGRAREQQDEIDFELDRSEPQVQTTSYWVGDDPYWADSGYDSPELLAFIQRLAGEDPRVARALERGQHDRVLTYVRRLTEPDPSKLPPLDAPIFDED